MYQSTIGWEGETRLTNIITSPDQQSLCLMTFKSRLEKTQGSKQELKEAICWGEGRGHMILPLPGMNECRNSAIYSVR